MKSSYIPSYKYEKNFNTLKFEFIALIMKNLKKIPSPITRSMNNFKHQEMVQSKF